MGDVLVTTCLSALAGVVGDGPRSCAARQWIAAFLCGCWLVAAVVLRPKCRHATHSSSVVGNLASSVVALCVALEGPDGVSDTVGMVATVYTSFVSVVVFASRWLLKTPRQSPPRRRATGRLQYSRVSDLPIIAVQRAQDRSLNLRLLITQICASTDCPVGVHMREDV